MASVADVVDRVLREYLEPADDLPLSSRVATAMSRTATQLSFEASHLAADELDAVAPGSRVEVGSELMVVTAADDVDLGVVTVARGQAGTSRTSHAEGDRVLFGPTFARSQVVQAVRDAVPALYPRLWRDDTLRVTWTAPAVTVPSEVLTPIVFRWTSASGRPAESSDLTVHGTSLVMSGVPSGTEGLLSWRGRFTVPSDESDDLGSLGVRAEWEQIVAVGAAASVLASRDAAMMTPDFLSEQVEAEVLPAGTHGRVATQLLRYREFLLTEAEKAQRAERGGVTLFVGNGI